jgi:hypothetical protein
MKRKRAILSFVLIILIPALCAGADLTPYREQLTRIDQSISECRRIIELISYEMKDPERLGSPPSTIVELRAMRFRLGDLELRRGDLKISVTRENGGKIPDWWTELPAWVDPLMPKATRGD